MSKFWTRLARRGAQGERGAILIMATAGVVLAVVAAALAVDLGTLAQERRRDQKVADLAAIDAARDFPNMQARALESAQRNGLPTTAGYAITAVEGTKVGGTCVASAGAGKVCVTVTSPHKNNFLAGSQIVQARAVAGTLAEAGYTIGSSLASASLDDATTNVPILNRVFGRFLGGLTGQANLLSYKGLAEGNVTLRQLQAAFGVGTLNELMTSNITMGQLLTATATALNNQGTVAAIDAHNRVLELQSVTTNTATFKLGDFIEASQGSGDSALDGNLNVLELITAGAEVANKNNLIDAGSIISLPVPGVGTLSTKLSIRVIEGPKWYRGLPGAGSYRKTSQLEITLTPTIDVNFTSTTLLLLTANLRLVGDLPVKFTAAGAEGLLQSVRCTAPNQGVTVQATSLPVTTHTSANLSIYSQGVPLVGGNVRVNLAVSPSDVNTITGGPYNLVFNYPNDFTPPDPDGQTTPGAPAGIDLTTGNVSVSVGVLGLSIPLLGSLTLSGVANAVIDPVLDPVMTAVANYLTTPALKSLGVRVGPVDVTAPADWFNPATCGQPGLVQ